MYTLPLLDFYGSPTRTSVRNNLFHCYHSDLEETSTHHFRVFFLFTVIDLLRTGSSETVLNSYIIDSNSKLSSSFQTYFPLMDLVSAFVPKETAQSSALVRVTCSCYVSDEVLKSAYLVGSCHLTMKIVDGIIISNHGCARQSSFIRS